jgi:hypothetical protein
MENQLLKNAIVVNRKTLAQNVVGLRDQGVVLVVANIPQNILGSETIDHDISGEDILNDLLVTDIEDHCLPTASTRPDGALHHEESEPIIPAEGIGIEIDAEESDINEVSKIIEKLFSSLQNFVKELLDTCNYWVTCWTANRNYRKSNDGVSRREYRTGPLQQFSRQRQSTFHYFFLSLLCGFCI